MKSFIHTLTLINTAVFIFECPPKYEEPVKGSFVPVFKSEPMAMGNPSNVIDTVSYSNQLMIKPQSPCYGGSLIYLYRNY